MKKSLISLSLIVIAIFAFAISVSCNKHNNSTENNEVELMLEELNNFNSKIFEKNNMERLYDYQSNSFSESLTKANRRLIVGVAIADGKFGWKGWKYGSKAGAIAGPHSAVVLGTLGALLAGTVASLVAYDKLNGGELCSSVISPLTPQDMIAVRDLCVDREIQSPLIEQQANDVMQSINMPEEFSYTLEVGEMHNAMAEVIMDRSFVIPQVQRDPSWEEQALISSPQFLSLYNEAKTEADCTLDNISGLDSILLEQIINLFCEAYSTCYDSVPDVDYIINNYISTLEGYNALSYEDKQTVYAGLSVVAFSSRYWYNND